MPRVEYESNPVRLQVNNFRVCLRSEYLFSCASYSIIRPLDGKFGGSELHPLDNMAASASLSKSIGSV
jgi:hypothetical protein